MRHLTLLLALALPTTAYADEAQQCIIMKGKVVDLRYRLEAARARREEWVKAHCKLVHKPVPGRHWLCDGKFAGNEGTVLQSPEERELEGFLYNAVARRDLCCAASPPRWCRSQAEP